MNPFHVFDRYEIHIQAFLYFINGKLIISNHHLHKSFFHNMYRKPQKMKKTEHGTYDIQSFDVFFRNLLSPRLTKMIFIQADSIIFLVFAEAFW